MMPALLTNTSIFLLPKKDFNLSVHLATLFRSPKSRGRTVTNLLLEDKGEKETRRGDERRRREMACEIEGVMEDKGEKETRDGV